MRPLLLLTLIALSPYALAAPAPIIGIPTVIDGDTLDIRSIRIRFHGVDAPESSQTCVNAQKQLYRCGQQAALKLSDKIAGRTVTCIQKDIDRYKRIVGQCSVAGEDLNRWLVKEGLAVAYLAYSKDYAREMDTARASKRGIWAGTFVMPADYRKGGGAPSNGSSSTATSPNSSAMYTSCREARAAGAAPLQAGSPGWNPKLDRDKDGVACE